MTNKIDESNKVQNSVREKKHRRGALIAAIGLSFFLLLAIIFSILLKDSQSIAPGDYKEPRVLATLDKSSFVISSPSFNTQFHTE